MTSLSKILFEISKQNYHKKYEISYKYGTLGNVAHVLKICYCIVKKKNKFSK